MTPSPLPNPSEYSSHDIPKPMDVEICPLCNSSFCHLHNIKDVHPEGEE